MRRRRLIMVVDDDREMLKMLGCTLKLEGYDVITTAESTSALSLLIRRRPDLVVLDIMMPVLDGYKVLGLIRQCSDVPVIMLTAKCDVLSSRSALVNGADDYVRKPFRTRELLARIRAKLRRARKEVAGT